MAHSANDPSAPELSAASKHRQIAQHFGVTHATDGVIRLSAAIALPDRVVQLTSASRTLIASGLTTRASDDAALEAATRHD